MVGQTQKAIVASRNALKKQPRFAAAMRYLVVNLANSGHEQEAIGVYNNLMQRDPTFSDAEVQKARFRVSQKNKETDLIQAIKKITG